MALVYWENGSSSTDVISVPAPGEFDPDWFEYTIPLDSGETVVSAGVDFVWGGTTKDHSWLLRSAPIESSGQTTWQFIFRRPTSGSYSVRLRAVIEDGN